jgi:large subunit ribosomal protein L24
VLARIKAEDTVEVRKGRERGKRGKVRSVNNGEGRAIIADINVMKKHVKPGQAARQAGIIDIEAPIQLSNLALVCSKCGKPSKVGTRLLDDGTKARFCKTCGELT